MLGGTFSRFLSDKLYMCVTQWSLPKKTKKHAIENLFLLFIVIAREHVGTQSMQGTLAGEHEKHARHVGTLSRKHVSAQRTLAREHVSM